MKKVIVAIIFLLLFNLNVCSAKTNNVAPYEMKKANNIIVQKLNNGGITVNTRTATIYDSYQGKNVSVEYDTFIPAGVNPNSKVIIYSADLDSYSTLKQSILNSNLDSIVVYYKLNWIGPDSYKRLATEIMSDLKQEYNLSSNYYIADTANMVMDNNIHNDSRYTLEEFQEKYGKVWLVGSMNNNTKTLNEEMSNINNKCIAPPDEATYDIKKLQRKI